MRGIRVRHVVGFVMLATISAGCDGGKKATDPTTTVASTAPATTTSSTTRLQSVHSTCAELLVEDRSLRAQENTTIQKLEAARASNPNSPDVQTLDTERVQIQRTLVDVDNLLTQMRARNGASACPSH